MRPIACAALAALLAIPAAAQTKAKAVAKPKLTAVIGVEAVYLTADVLPRYRALLLVVNDGAALVDLSKLASALYLDGEPVQNASVRSMLSGGPPDPLWKSLPPGEHLQFGFRLDALTLKPGLHRLVWKGAGLLSNEARLLVAPKKG